MKKVSLTIIGMHCASCAGKIEKALRSRTGVEKAVVNFGTETATVTYDPLHIGIDEFISTVKKVGYDARVFDAGTSHHDQDKHEHHKEDTKLSRKLWISIILTIPIILWTMTPIVYQLSMPKNYLFLILSTPVIFWGGSFMFVNAYKGLKSFSANMDTLIALGVGAAYTYSLLSTFYLIDGPVFYETATALVCFIILGRVLEARAKGKTKQAL